MRKPIQHPGTVSTRKTGKLGHLSHHTECTVLFLTSRSPITAPAVLWQGLRRTTSTLLFSTMARTEADINTDVQYYGKDRGGRQHCCSVLWQGPRRTSTLMFSTMARTEADINTAVQYYGKDRGGHQHCCSVLWQGPRRTSTLLFSTMARTEADINTAVQYCGKDRGGHQHCCSVLWQGPRRTTSTQTMHLITSMCSPQEARVS